MDLLRQHEVFEIELLDRFKKGGFLERLIFGGGTMLRLCHDMNRYSADLDFWFLKGRGKVEYYHDLRKFLATYFELTDTSNKFFTLLYEIRAKGYPKRLKLEIRKEARRYAFEEKIAFSTYGTRQVLVKGLTLEQMMKNKVEALLERKEIRDAFDIEFMLRRGVGLLASKKDLLQMEKVIQRFKPYDFRVTLGSVLEPEARAYYRKHQFRYLTERIRSSLT